MVSCDLMAVLCKGIWGCVVSLNDIFAGHLHYQISKFTCVYSVFDGVLLGFNGIVVWCFENLPMRF